MASSLASPGGERGRGAGAGGEPARGTVSVSQLTGYLKTLLDSSDFLADIPVEGEVSNLKRHTSGHLYFTLKDAVSSLRCVLFRSYAQRQRFSLENGQHVVARGSVSVYERDGIYQLYVRDLYPVGAGSLFLALQQLKERLGREGLFDETRKRPLPFLPRRVGVVTSPTGAALRDILAVTGTRAPGVDVVLAPALVQGEEAAASIAAALELLGRRGGVDVIIVGRGGGSLEDLWPFNSETVARAIAASPVPVVSAVGHETDFSISDLVADRRAPTPSAAAEMVAPARRELQENLAGLGDRLVKAVEKRVALGRQRLAYLAAGRVLARPEEAWLAPRRQDLDGLAERLYRAGEVFLERSGDRLGAVAGRLDSLSPLAVLGRGFAICRRAAGGPPITSARQVAAGERVQVVLRQGSLACLVEAAASPAGDTPAGGEPEN